MTVNSLALGSLFVLSLAALLLAVFVLRRWKGPATRAYLLWGIGLLLVCATTFEEAVIYAGVWSQPLIQSYFVMVAVLVGILSLGSAELALKGRWRTAWYGYIGTVSFGMIVAGFLLPVGPSVTILTSGVVTGNPPLPTLVLSSLLTIPGSLMLSGAAVYGIVKNRSWQLLYIVAGVVLIAIAGSLYAFFSFQVTLYYTEFVGFVLLFFGFVKVPGISASFRSVRAASIASPGNSSPP